MCVQKSVCVCRVIGCVCVMSGGGAGKVTAGDERRRLGGAAWWWPACRAVVGRGKIFRRAQVARWLVPAGSSGEVVGLDGNW